MEDNRPATLADLQASEARMMEAIRDLETRILTEFHKWAAPFQMRQRSHSAVLRTLDVELEQLEGRVKELESPRDPK